MLLIFNFMAYQTKNCNNFNNNDNVHALGPSKLQFLDPPVLSILYITSGNFLIYGFWFLIWISHVTLPRTNYNAQALFNVTPNEFLNVVFINIQILFLKIFQCCPKTILNAKYRLVLRSVSLQELKNKYYFLKINLLMLKYA